MESAKELHSLLSCLANFKGSRKDQHAQVEVRQTELLFMVKARSKHTQVTGNIPANLFSSFQCNPCGGSFCINLGTLMECLGIFGTQATANTTVTMEYRASVAAFELTLEEQGIFTTCQLSTIDSDEYTSESWDMMTTAFKTSNQVCKTVLKSELLKEALYELQDLQGASTVKVVMSPLAPYFQLASGGNLGSLEIEFNKSSDLFVYFDCEATSEWEYPLQSLLQGMRALLVAAETYVRINDEGIMCIQHQIVASSGKKCFVDFLMVPTADEDDDDEGAHTASAAPFSSRGAAEERDGSDENEQQQQKHLDRTEGSSDENDEEAERGRTNAPPLAAKRVQGSRSEAAPKKRKGKSKHGNKGSGGSDKQKKQMRENLPEGPLPTQQMMGKPVNYDSDGSF